jgi:2-C-methyl-D-erythritol 4-phosphate cytidylyltransferase
MNVAIIAAAGQGTRMAGERPKQFIELAGVPILFHTLRAFEQCDLIQEIIVVLPALETATFLSLANKYSLRKLAKVVPGGATRAESVLHGLQAVREATAEIVGVHDGVRPFVTPDEITRTVEAAKLEGAAILVSSPVDTLKEVKDGVVVKTLRRADLRNALTPQCFQYKLLRRAYDEVDITDSDLTDVEGSPRNIKITTQEDILLGEALLKQGV